jgi:hypothetical protein
VSLTEQPNTSRHAELVSHRRQANSLINGVENFAGYRKDIQKLSIKIKKIATCKKTKHS